MEGTIGTLNWNDCCECKHGKEEGGCAIEGDMYIEMSEDYNSVVCGTFQEQEADNGEGD